MARTLATRATVHLMIDHPFFASLLLSLNIKEEPSIDTAATDGVNIYINPTFWQELSLAHQMFVLAHEVLHPGFLHHTRRGGRDHELWNIACDYAINPILKNSGLSMPDWVCYKKKYIDWGAEKIYEDLAKDARKKARGKSGGDGQDGKGGKGSFKPGDKRQWSIGDVMDFPAGKGDDQETQHRMEEMEQIHRMAAAYKQAKSMGKGTPGIERHINELLEPKANWEDVLLQMISEKLLDDYNWTAPNRRLMQTGFYFPSLDGEKHKDLAIICDTSASIGQEQLDVFAAEVNAIGELANSTKYALYVDSRMHGKHEEFDPGDTVELRFRGGGGTDFRPGFEYLDKNDIETELIIYFTDGYCNRFPEHEPDAIVIWAIYDGDNNFNPPFGDVLHIPKDGLNS